MACLACDSTIAPSELKPFFTRAELERLDKIQTEAAIAQAGLTNLVSCPRVVANSRLS